jgi:hypothetical protein
MKPEHENYPISGMTEQEAMDILKAPVTKLIHGKDAYDVVDSPDSAITAFIGKGKVSSVRIQAPFSGDVRGIHIGDSEEEVLKTLGQPLRIWKRTLDVEGWFYDDKKFFRVDFSKELGDRVVRIYV